MITRENLKNILNALNFEGKGNLFTKKYIETDVILSIDFKNEKIVYPEDQGLKINERQTCNFSSNENFVVFLCIDSLLEKGYKAKHIELEPKWKLGHGASGGRADILIKDNSDKPILIIECKTFGKEFDKAWKNTLIDGDQLFSYAQQIPEVDFLCLYTIGLTKELKLNPISYIISHKDNVKILEENKSLKSFEKAQNVKDRFNVWKDTYKCEYTTKGIFEKNIQPYHIGKDKYTIDDLNPIDIKNKDGKYHEFRTILRKYNVSGRENAFDVLVNLFICKIVDEMQNSQDLKFYWKGIAYDNYFDLIDRLQELYKIGMDKFLAQEIIYISNKEIDEAFWTVNQKKNATKQQIKNYFRQLKFFTNNNFAFIDVHNEKLFYQNAKVLLGIVQMWQDCILRTKEHNQFLGDMFEFFLDDGIKQSQGQFFTPMSVCKFILMSLPLENIILKKNNTPKVIDYACGAGHFLTEYASQITPFLKKYKQDNIEEYYSSIIGIEKEYRLSKVAKLYSFMYGYEGINILHHDALDNHVDIKESSFDILIANPPFTVEGFLETISDEVRNKYELIDTIQNISSNDNIEVFFIERAKMLLNNGGIAGIIIPASVLSTTDTTYIRTREILLKFFDIVAIVELGKNTFNKTPSNTVVLFLKRKIEKPEQSEHFENRINDWFEGSDDEKESEIYQDSFYIKKYCEHLDIEYEDYIDLVNGTWNEKLLNYEIFEEYREDFFNTKEYSRISDKAIGEEEKKIEVNRELMNYMQRKEKNKLYYFVLAYCNSRNVIVVRSPENNKDLKEYRGYEWSGGKGNEGIKYNGGDTVENIRTPLFDPQNRYNSKKVNYLIQKNYNGEEITADDIKNAEYNVEIFRLIDLLRFKDRKFDKRIWLSNEETVSIESKWPLVKLENICTIVRGASPRPIDNYITENKDGVNWIKIGDVNENDKFITKTAQKITKEGAIKSRYVKEGDFILSNSMSFGRPYILKIDGCIHDGWLLMTDFSEKINKDYLYEILSYDDTQRQFSNSAAGGVVKNLNKDRVKYTKIPLPPLEVQESIIKEIETFEKTKNQHLKDISIKEYEILIKKLRNDLIRMYL